MQPLYLRFEQEKKTPSAWRMWANIQSLLKSFLLSWKINTTVWLISVDKYIPSSRQVFLFLCGLPCWKHSWGKSWSGWHGVPICKVRSMHLKLRAQSVGYFVPLPKAQSPLCISKMVLLQHSSTTKNYLSCSVSSCLSGGDQFSLAKEVIKTLHLPCFLSDLQPWWYSFPYHSAFVPICS